MPLDFSFKREILRKFFHLSTCIFALMLLYFGKTICIPVFLSLAIIFFGLDFLRIKNKHIQRLYKSLKYVRIDPGLTEKDSEEISLELIKRNRHLIEDNDDFWIIQRVTRGVFPSSFPAVAAIAVSDTPFCCRCSSRSAGCNWVESRAK